MRLKEKFLSFKGSDNTAYVQRLSYITENSYNTAKVAVLCDGTDSDAKLVKRLYQNQIEFNNLSKSSLDDGTAKIGADGTITVNGHIYTAVIAADKANVPDEIKEFSAYGGKLLGADYDIEKLPREIKTDSFQPDLRFSHIIREGVDIYIFANDSETPIKTKVYIGDGGLCEIWNPKTALCTPCTIDENEKINLSLNGEELLLYVISDNFD